MIRVLTARQMGQWLPRRKREAHKGDCGRIYILGGSRGMVGAPILSAWGAVKGGAGLVRLGTIQSQQRVAAKRVPLEVTTDALPETRKGFLMGSRFQSIQHNIDRFKTDILALGPGLGVSKETISLLNGLLHSKSRPVVLDADALNILAEGKKAFRFLSPTILTPHPGELGRLLKVSISKIQKNRDASARLAAKRFNCICLLKGTQTVVTDGRSSWINPTGNSAMASGGMGDVLTGLIAALWGQDPNKDLESGLRAACLGAYLHGLAGDLAFKKLGGLSVQASDLAQFIPRAISTLR